MLKLNWKKVKETMSSREIDLFIKQNFFDLKTTDIAKLKIVAENIRKNLAKCADRLNSSFDDKNSPLYLALRMMQITHRKRADLRPGEIGELSDKQIDEFFKFARRVVEYYNNEEPNTIRAKNQIKVSGKVCGRFLKK